jgi:hypothetical protein
LSKSDLSILNKRSLKYNLADAEKDYLLAVVSDVIINPRLKKNLFSKEGPPYIIVIFPRQGFPRTSILHL